MTYYSDGPESDDSDREDAVVLLERVRGLSVCGRPPRYEAAERVRRAREHRCDLGVLQRLHRREHACREDVREQDKRAVRQLCRAGRLQRAEVEKGPAGLGDADILRLPTRECRDAEEA